jgi:hypothetical protein
MCDVRHRRCWAVLPFVCVRACGVSKVQFNTNVGTRANFFFFTLFRSGCPYTSDLRTRDFCYGSAFGNEGRVCLILAL